MNPTMLLPSARRLLVGALLVASVAGAAPAHAQQVVPTAPLANPDGTLAGFATSEPSLYFLAPSRWAPLDGAQTPALRLTTAAGAPGSYDLRLVLSPDYARAAPAVVATRQHDPAALFFPLPRTIQRVTLFLPAALGAIEAELTPAEDGLSTPIALYYRLRFTGPQLEVLRTLARGGLALQGGVEYEFLAPGGVEATAAPLTVFIDEADLALVTSPPPDPTAWLADLLATTQLRAPGVLDGPYALGGGVGVTITDSVVEGRMLPGASALAADEHRFRLTPTRTPDLAGVVTFRVPQLGLSIRVDYEATMSAELDLLSMQLSITQLDITRVTVSGSSSPFYTQLLRQLMRRPDVQGRLSQTLTAELQKRILAETLFGLEAVLP